MNIGLWNIDHPETGSGTERKEQRFGEITTYLIRADCDAFILPEANSALVLPGYFCEFSEASPFRSSSRFYGEPNIYHQVAIYCKSALERLEVEEPINGLLCRIMNSVCPTRLYGNVVTIKDQWSKESSKTYSDRLDEQIRAIQELDRNGTVVGGDFNLRLGWKQKQSAYLRVKEELAADGWAWPTQSRTDTVQHVLHPRSMNSEITMNFDITYQSNERSGLSDHPFVGISLL